MSNVTAIKPAVTTLSKVRALGEELNKRLIGRTAEIRSLQVALVTGQHMLMIGPPGTAKSLLARHYATGCGLSYFDLLLTRYTALEEVFGPVKLSALKADRFERATKGYLPEAQVAFLDEIFKCNSASLNALLTAINERVFHNGDVTMKLPLRTVVGASNELPEDSSLEAFFDRFLLRHWVPLTEGSKDFLKLIDPNGLESSPMPVCLTPEDVDAAGQEVAKVGVSKPVLQAMMKLRAMLAKEGVKASDRRWRSMVKLVQGSAWLDGRSDADTSDLEILQFSLWTEEDQAHRDMVKEKVMACCEGPVQDAQAVVDSVLLYLTNTLEDAQGLSLDMMTKELGKASREAGVAKAKVEAFRAKATPAQCKKLEDMVRPVDQKVAEMKALLVKAAGL